MIANNHRSARISLEEPRVLAAMICGTDEEFAACDSLEPGDLVSYAHQAILEAIRNVHAHDGVICVDTIADELERADAEQASVTAEICLPVIGFLLLDQRPYHGSTLLIADDVQWIRKLAKARRDELVLAEMQRPSRRRPWDRRAAWERAA